MQGMREIVVDLYDPHFEYTRQTQKEKIVIKRPAVNIIAASTIDWLREKLSEGDMRGGLMGRFLLFPGMRKQESKGLVLDTHKDDREWLIGFLRMIHQQERSWVDLVDIRQPYNTWLTDIEKSIEININPELIGFQSRIGNHALKLLVLFTVSGVGPVPKYQPQTDDLNRACILAHWLMEQAQQLAMTGFTKSKTELQVQKLIQMAARNGGIDRSTALQNMHMTSQEFDRVVATAVDRAEIAVERIKKANHIVTVYAIPRDGLAGGLA
jgi:hypothetical protein